MAIDLYVIPSSSSTHFPFHLSHNMRGLRSLNSSSSSPSCKRHLHFHDDGSSAKKSRHTPPHSAISRCTHHVVGSDGHRNIPRKNAVRDTNQSIAICEDSLTKVKMRFEGTPPRDTVVDASPSAYRPKCSLAERGNDSHGSYQGPYPSYTRPSREECIQVCQKLWQLHGPLEEYAKHRNARISNPQMMHFRFHDQKMPKIEVDCVDELPASIASGHIEKLVGCRNAKIGNSQTSVLEHHSQKVPKMEENSVDKIVESHSFMSSSTDPQERRTVLDSLIATILSQNTTDRNSRRAFARLKSRFPSWEEVHDADPKEIEDLIRCAGLAERKASRMLNILSILQQEKGKLCLEYIKGLPTEAVKQELARFKGVGPKTVACVLMFHLRRDEFPVDTHVFRITKMLQWVPANANREKAYLHLNNRIPDELKFDLHCLIVTHGKRCPRCAKGGRIQQPADGPCPLNPTDIIIGTP